jgi:two-component system nitrate/nitrite response regulator NarL
MTRCLVADDHAAVAVTVAAIVSELGYEVLGPAADGLAAVELAAWEQPPLAVVDHRMPKLAGTALIERLIGVAPHLRIVVYSGQLGVAGALGAFEAGAAAVVLKDAPLHDVRRALALVAAGETYADPQLAAGLAARGRRGPPLSDRERQVLSCLAAGLSHEQVAAQLEIAVGTVRKHVVRARRRLGARTKTAAVAAALRQGLIE